MFPKNKIVGESSPHRAVLETVEEVGDKFITTYKSDDSVLPDAENFELKKMLDSGVDLKQVNPKIIDSGAMPNLFEKNEIQDDIKNDDKGVNNDEE